MKTRIFLLCVSVLALAHNACAEWPWEKYTDERIAGLEKVIEQQKEKIKELSESRDSLVRLEKFVQQQTEKINEITAKLNETRQLIDKNLEDIQELQGGTNQNNHRLTIIVSIMGAVVVLVLMFFGFLLWPRKHNGQSARSSGSGSSPKCPRCGWEHDPGDTVCKNPACKTQF